MSWFQAEAYCTWAGGSLPTEAQWEKAARGDSSKRPFPWGSETPSCDLVNAKIDDVRCIADTSRVGSYSAAGDSPYGLQDMAVNVYEWMKDWYSATYYYESPDSNPQGPLSGDLRVRRSGAFGSSEDFLRVTARIQVNPEASKDHIGFRCAYGP